jgi:hypothetical protein
MAKGIFCQLIFVLQFAVGGVQKKRAGVLVKFLKAFCSLTVKLLSRTAFSVIKFFLKIFINKT